MTYAADLIDKARTATAITSDSAMAVHLGVNKQAVSNWRHGRGSPMSQERVIELCDLAGIPEQDRGYWLTGVERDAVTITSVRRALDVVLDRLRPTVAAVGLVVLASAYALPAKAHSMLAVVGTEPDAAMYIMRSIGKP